MRGRVRLALAAVVAVLAASAASAVAGCTTGSVPAASGSPGPDASPAAATSTPASTTVTTPVETPQSTTATPPSSHAPPGTPAQVALAAMTLPERVGQLFMVDSPSSGADATTITAVRTSHVGSVILDGNSDQGVARTRAVTAKLQSLVARGPALFVATDQEGGLVQRLRGPGFSDIPSALAQGQVSPGQLRTRTTAWAAQLRAAGVNLDLAPVMDTVPAGSGPNPPIGDLDREYGHTPSAVGAHGVAVLEGLAAAGIAATAKHFPGLGRVPGNTDTATGVTDTVTTAGDAYLQPFADAIKAHVPFVMMSTAIYTHLDPTQPAAFSKKIVTGLLRDRLGFGGVVISDDLGNAKQVGGYAPGVRAVKFIAAGGDMVLTVDGSLVAPMVAAVLARAKSSAAFRAQVNAAALRVLRAKQHAGLL